MLRACVGGKEAGRVPVTRPNVKPAGVFPELMAGVFLTVAG